MAKRQRRSKRVEFAAGTSEGIPGIPGTQDLQRNESLPPQNEIGTTGLAQFSGLIFQEPLIELRGKEAYKRYDEMRRNSPIIAGLILSIENPIRSTSWNWASDDGDTDPRLDLLERAEMNMEHSLIDHISEAMTVLPFGYSLFEMCYQQVGSEMLWKKWSPRAQNSVLRWIYEEVSDEPNVPDSSKHYELRGFVQLAPPKYQLKSIPIEKLFNYRIHVELDNPEGRSILRNAWIPYFYVKHLQQVEAIGIERNLAGLPVITLPIGASTGPETGSDASKAAKIVRNLRNDEQAGVVLPNGWELALLRSGGNSGAATADTDKVISRHTKDMLTSSLAQFLMLGQAGIGSLALSKDQTDFFTMSVNAIADIFAEVITKQVIPPLMKMNGYDADGLRIEHTPAQGEMGIQILSDVIQKAGPYMHWTPEDEVWLRQAIGMPEKSVEELQQLTDEANTAQAAIAANAAAAKQQQPVVEPKATPTQDDTTPDIRFGLDLYAAQALDKAKRDRSEAALRRATMDYFRKAKARVMKEARRMR